MAIGDDIQVPDRIYSERQLAKLLEISSAVKCECPNHLSKIVEALIGFEDYSKTCIIEGEEDARIHELLYRETAAARHIMEKALVELCAFEGFEV